MNRIFVAALKEETPNLDYFFHTGVGKINASYNLIKLINKFNPKEVINYGTAGSLKFINDRGAAGVDGDLSGTITFFADDSDQNNQEFADVVIENSLEKLPSPKIKTRNRIFG